MNSVTVAALTRRMRWTRIILGRRLANREAGERRIGALEGLPAMGLDGLGSASYGPEAMLAVLAVAGAGGLGAVQPLTAAIVGLLAVLCFSYWQTITAYPKDGGSYTVARENLGAEAGLLAAAALMLDYMLNVAVGISAGVGALTSALPSLEPFTLPLCLAILLAITLVNLRGTAESGLALALPTYGFIATLLATLVLGLVASFGAAGHPHPVVAPPAPPHPAAGVGAPTLWLLVRAFAAGCTAMTGVEAVSNGVGAFKEPTVRHAHRTLLAMGAVLGALLLGIAFLAHAYGIAAMPQTAPGYQSVISQLVGAVAGRGVFYFATLASVLAVLCLSANTSFVGFPRLCRQIAADGYLPKAFALPGRRLVYTVGIAFLAAGAAVLLAAFGGITDRLIPLFAIGAFLSFTMSQAGMAAHWKRHGAGLVDRLRFGVNGFGALATALALAVILLAKFTEGAWVTLLVVPLGVALLHAVHRYYRDLDRQMFDDADRSLDTGARREPVVLIPLERWDRMARRAVELAVRVSSDVRALHLADLDGTDATDHEHALRAEWDRSVARPAVRAGFSAPTLRIASSPYRSVLAPLLRAVAEIGADRPVIVVLSELAGGRWWETVLHTNRTRRLRRLVLRHGGPTVSVLLVPWQLNPPATARAVADEEDEGEATAGI